VQPRRRIALDEDKRNKHRTLPKTLEAMSIWKPMKAADSEKRGIPLENELREVGLTWVKNARLVRKMR
jgi:hypothetical protein